MKLRELVTNTYSATKINRDVCPGQTKPMDRNSVCIGRLERDYSTGLHSTPHGGTYGSHGCQNESHMQISHQFIPQALHPMVIQHVPSS